MRQALLALLAVLAVGSASTVMMLVPGEDAAALVGFGGDRSQLVSTASCTPGAQMMNTFVMNTKQAKRKVTAKRLRHARPKKLNKRHRVRVRAQVQQTMHVRARGHVQYRFCVNDVPVVQDFTTAQTYQSSWKSPGASWNRKKGHLRLVGARKAARKGAVQKAVQKNRRKAGSHAARQVERELLAIAARSAPPAPTPLPTINPVEPTPTVTPTPEPQPSEAPVPTSTPQPSETPTPSPAPPAPTPTIPAPSTPEEIFFEQVRVEFFELINAERVAVGAPAYIRVLNPQPAADAWMRGLVDEYMDRYYAGTAHRGAALHRADYVAAGCDPRNVYLQTEVIASVLDINQNRPPRNIAERLVESWRGSPPHWQLLMSVRMTHASLGLARSSDGMYVAAMADGLWMNGTCPSLA